MGQDCLETKMTPEAKRALHELIYYRMLGKGKRYVQPRGGRFNPYVCYVSAYRQANYCLEALGERLDYEI